MWDFIPEVLTFVGSCATLRSFLPLPAQSLLAVVLNVCALRQDVVADRN
jgi:hypothetical protein